MKYFFILMLFYASFEFLNSMSYFGLEKEQYNTNSDEERFYIDESQWDMDFESLSSRSLPDSDRNQDIKKASYENVVVKVGRKAILPCFVDNLGSFKVIWAKNGDILSLGTIKINDDNRLKVQHRYISEWHLIIEKVVTDDEGEYICKTNGNFYKIIKLQVLMPPTMDDTNSIPAGTINLKEGSTLNLRCFAEGKPEPTVRWYRWKKYNHLETNKEELNYIGNQITITDINRNDPNTYECIAKNSVPPATSRVFNIEIHFLPVVVLSKNQDISEEKFSIECLINSNPLERVFWYRNGEVLNKKHHQKKSDIYNKYHITTEDVSTLYELHKTLLTLTVTDVEISDFGEYQCCAMNMYGQICSNIHIEIGRKSAITKKTTTLEKLVTTKSIHDYLFQTEKEAQVKLIDSLNTNPRLFKDKISTSAPDKNQVLNMTELKNLDTLETKRHFLKSKQHLNLDSKASPRSTSCTSSIYVYLTLSTIILMSVF